MSDNPFSARRVKASFSRLVLEELESRLAPAANPFPGLANSLNSALTNGFGTVVQDVKQMQAALPIVGKSLAQEATVVQNTLNSIESLAHDKIAGLLTTFDGNTIAQKLMSTGVFTSVNVTNLDLTNGNIT